MRSGIILSSEEVREIIAKYYHVHKDDVIKTKFSYIVVDAKCGDIIKCAKGGETNGF